MTSDFTAFEFVEGKTYSLEVEPGHDAVRVTHHGEGAMEPQTSYGALEYAGSVGSGPWRNFRDWETESEISVNAHHIVDATESRSA